ncbi:MAG: endopeptidase La [Armatimonadota bacterium]|nr:endopeptidase La [Armatimonadota bacterium]
MARNFTPEEDATPTELLLESVAPDIQAPQERKLPRALPLVPLREAVYFPGQLFPLFVGRDKSIRALDQAMSKHKFILLAAQRVVAAEDPDVDGIYEVGLLAEIVQVLKVPDGTVRVMLEGVDRIRVIEYTHTEPYFKARYKVLRAAEEWSVEIEALMRSVVTQFEQVVQNGRSIPPEVMVSVVNMDDPGRLADTIAPLLPVRVEVKQEILEIVPIRRRLEELNVILQKECEILEIQRNIRSRVEKEMGNTQREFILREQMKAIQQELGEHDERTGEIEDYKEKITQAAMPQEVSERVLKEVDRLEKMPYAAPEGVVVRTYLDSVISLPWNKRTDESLDLDGASKVLDEDHYGLTKVKERVLEFLAVRKLTGTNKGPILCFVGPPGVGKTSIGKSIARALGRKFIRVSLGGVRDEAEIRGHRRTYVGALPGRIIQGIKQSGYRNPVFMLDEIDKIGIDFRGDPSSALLEALDPEQNEAFSDHYLEVPFDLRDVMFITTANVLDTIPPALRDRMEVIPFAGYIEDEKLRIAEQFLVPKQIRENGLTTKNITFETGALRRIIREYTREAGVRSLEREIASICRKVAKEVAKGNGKLVAVREEDIKTYLGQRKYHYGMAEEKDEIATATGLVYTEFGGDIVSIEVGLLRSNDGKLTLTGQLGDVMKESAQAALTYVRSKARALDLDEEFYERTDIHIHVPAGAVPKDGPSAGITIATALASALTKRPVRKDVAMTGEITLRGRVLPVGGVKEKVLAAHRAGIRTVIIPKENEKDLEEIPDDVRAQIKFEMVEHADDVLRIALLNPEGSAHRTKL